MFFWCQVPPKATWTGGYRAVGKSLEQARPVWQQVQAFEAAGAFAVEIEVVAAPLATENTKPDENRGRIPLHAKSYRNFAAERDRLQAERISAYREYISDVASGAFPQEGHIVDMEADIMGRLWDG